MYPQIMVDEKDQDWQHIFWPDENSNVCPWAMTRLTIVLSSAPYLATRVLKMIGEERSENEQNALNIILSRFSFDDMLVSFKTIGEAHKNVVKVKNILRQYSFN
jgi:hypothetical protein